MIFQNLEKKVFRAVQLDQFRLETQKDQILQTLICYAIQFAIFNPWKVSWNWRAFSQFFFAISPGLFCHLIRCDSRQLAKADFTSNLVSSLKSFKNCITGWTEKRQIPKEIFPYYSHRSEITHHEGILLKNQRITVPTTLCSEMKSIIHQGHSGLENLKKVLVKPCFGH